MKREKLKIYNQVKKTALPYIEVYQNDLLVHDRNTIDRYDTGTPFLHFTGETGTNIVMMPDAVSEIWPKPGERD